jgi:DNA-directed RNA polymerase subunit F
MQIRSQQMEEFAKGRPRAFDDEMIVHLAEFSPPLFKVIKKDQMREVVRFGIGQASQYGFTLRGPVRLYLELMLLFGSHFDTDPQYPWANEILADRASTPEMERAEALHRRTLDYQENVSGRDAVNTRKALSELTVLVKQPETLSTNDVVADIRQEMTRVFPQKAKYIGEESLSALIEKGIAEARRRHFPSVRGEALVTILMFAFGHGCTHDPLYPWIARTLEDPRIVNPAARAARLEHKAVTWLNHVVALNEQRSHS